MTAKISKTVKIAAIFIFTVAVGIVCAGVFVQRYRALTDLEAQRNQLRDSNNDMERDIAELKDMQVMFETDPAFVVITARKENYMHPREIVFIFPKE